MTRPCARMRWACHPREEGGKAEELPMRGAAACCEEARRGHCGVARHAKRACSFAACKGASSSSM
eukprot:14556433-Alexandrium_andersonii.AAC.1